MISNKLLRRILAVISGVALVVAAYILPGNPAGFMALGMAWSVFFILPEIL